MTFFTVRKAADIVPYMGARIPGVSVQEPCTLPLLTGGKADIGQAVIEYHRQMPDYTIAQADAARSDKQAAFGSQLGVKPAPAFRYVRGQGHRQLCRSRHLLIQNYCRSVLVLLTRFDDKLVMHL